MFLLLGDILWTNQCKVVWGCLKLLNYSSKKCRELLNMENNALLAFPLHGIKKQPQNTTTKNLVQSRYTAQEPPPGLLLTEEASPEHNSFKSDEKSHAVKVGVAPCGKSVECGQGWVHSWSGCSDGNSGIGKLNIRFAGEMRLKTICPLPIHYQCCQTYCLYL